MPLYIYSQMIAVMQALIHFQDYRKQKANAHYFTVSGLGNSGPEHWQTFFETSGNNFQRINQTEWDAPACNDWIETIDKTLSDYDLSSVILIGHSLGCATIAHWTEKYKRKIKGALLVAPSDLEAPQYTFPTKGFSPMPMNKINFRTLSTKAAILFKLNRAEEARKIMDEAIPMGTVVDVHQYARTLLNAKEAEEAFKVYKANYAKYPNEFTTNVGMGRGYCAKGDYKKALIYMKVALPKAPNNFYKNAVETMIKSLEEGKDIN